MSVFTKNKDAKKEAKEGLAERLKIIEIRTFELIELFKKKVIEAALNGEEQGFEANDSDSNTTDSKPENIGNILGRTRYHKTGSKDDEAPKRPNLSPEELKKISSEIALIQLEIENLRDEKSELDRQLIDILEMVEYDSLMREIGIGVAKDLAANALKEAREQKESAMKLQSQTLRDERAITHAPDVKEKKQIRKSDEPGHDPESPELESFHGQTLNQKSTLLSKRFLDIC